jgi:hypothetical protein
MCVWRPRRMRETSPIDRHRVIRAALRRGLSAAGSPNTGSRDHRAASSRYTLPKQCEHGKPSLPVLLRFELRNASAARGRGRRGRPAATATRSRRRLRHTTCGLRGRGLRGRGLGDTAARRCPRGRPTGGSRRRLGNTTRGLWSRWLWRRRSLWRRCAPGRSGTGRLGRRAGRARIATVSTDLNALIACGRCLLEATTTSSRSTWTRHLNLPQIELACSPERIGSIPADTSLAGPYEFRHFESSTTRHADRWPKARSEPEKQHRLPTRYRPHHDPRCVRAGRE